MVWFACVLISMVLLWIYGIDYRARKQEQEETARRDEISRLVKNRADVSPESPQYQALTNRILFLSEKT